MKMWSDANLRRDLIKLVCVAAALLGTAGLFFVTPALSTPTAVSLVITMVLSPLVAALERKGYPRALSIAILFTAVGGFLVFGGFKIARSGEAEWDSFREHAPIYFEATIQKLRAYELDLKTRFPFLNTIHPTDTLVAWGQDTGRWFVVNGPGIMGEILSCLFIVPILCFVMLNDGRAIRQRYFQLIPNRFFETAFLMTHEITTALSDYLRAKLVEALLVGAMTAAGLALVGAPYAIVLGVLAGVTNIIPYLGPVVGAIPGILIVFLDSSHGNLLWPVVIVYLAANIIDMVVIFPVIVAKLVNLHPLILIAVVALGQKYYGLIGMLISIPIASVMKVVLVEIYSAVYGEKATRQTSNNPMDYESPLLRPE